MALYSLDELLDPIVIDVGSGITRVGVSEIEVRRYSEFPTVLGRWKQPEFMIGFDPLGKSPLDCFVGVEAQAKRGILKLFRPYEDTTNSSIDMKNLLNIYHACFAFELRNTSPEKSPVLINSLPRMNDQMYEKLGEFFFERFGVQYLSICDSSVLSLLASGKTTGISVEMGHSISKATAIHDGLPIHKSRIVMEDLLDKRVQKRIAGSRMTDLFSKLLNSAKRRIVPYDDEYFFARTSAEREVTQDMKEKYCALTLDENRFVTSSLEEHIPKIIESDEKIDYELPDGTLVALGEECFLVPEILFKPSLLEGYERIPGIHKIVELSIELCDSSLQNMLWSNIFLSGGTTKITNFRERLLKELKKVKRFDKHMIQIEHSRDNDPALATWMGGGVFCRNTLQDKETVGKFWVQYHEYNESGYSIMRRKFGPLVVGDNDDQIRLLRSLTGKSGIGEEEEEEEMRRKFILGSSFCFGDFFVVKTISGTIQIKFKSLLV